MVTIDNSEENQVLGQNATQSAVSDAQVLTAGEAVGSVMVDEDVNALPPVIAAQGRSHFIPNTNSERMVTIITPAGENNRLLVKCTAAREDVGVSIDERLIETIFGNVVTPIPHKQQVTVVLVNGLQLVGYRTKTKSRNGFYFPKKYLPGSFPLPQQGTVQPILVAKLIVG